LAATCCHCEPVEPQNDQSLVAALLYPWISSSSSKLVDLARVEPSEAFTDVAQQSPQLFLVVGGDELSSSPMLRLLRGDSLGVVDVWGR